jgi:O-antigen/teichoic acid export membrane protein
VAYERLFRDSNRGRHQSIYGRIREAATESVFRNSAFLTASLILTAISGFGATVLLTRLYSVEAVGLSAAAASAGALIDFLTQFGASYSLPRFLPTSERRGALINTLLTITTVAALVGVFIFLTLPIAAKIYAVGGMLFIIAFLFFTTFDAGQTNLGVVLVVDGQADKIARASIFTNLVNLVAPAAFLFLGMTGAYISRVISGTAGFFVCAFIIRKRGHKFRPMLSGAATRGLRKFSVGAYISNILSGLPQLVLPVIILSRFGSEATAYWYTAMLMATTLISVPGTVSRVLLPEASHRISERRALVRRSTMLMLGVSIPTLGVAYLAAPIFLLAFGHDYAAEGLTPLRLLIVAGLVSGINYATGTILVIAKKTLLLTITNGATAAVVLGMALMWANNLNEIAVSWCLGVVTSTVLFAVFAAFSIHEVHGRWENLGGDQLAIPASARKTFHKDSQLAGLEMLRSLSLLQRTGPGYQSGEMPEIREPDSPENGKGRRAATRIPPTPKPSPRSPEDPGHRHSPPSG